MSDMEVLAIIAYIIAGVLVIILFFKVWGMTNNVSRISRGEIPKVDGNGIHAYYEKIRFAYFKGDVKMIQKSLDELLISKILNVRDEMTYKEVPKIIDEVAPLYKKFGLDMPANILKLADNPEDIILST